MLGTRRRLSLLLAAAVATFGLGLAAGADSATEGEFLTLINSSRADNGLGPLTVDGGLRSHARNHTQDMIDAGEIYHSTSAELMAAAGSGWSQLAENVGRGNTPSSLHAAFMDSSGHRANILGDYNYVGIGTGTGDGRLYVTVVFMKKGSTTTTTTSTQPAPTTTTATGTTATTKASAETTITTLAPTTTITTLIVGPDKPVTPGENCVEATRFWQLCHD
jgi:hypothetical protein